MSVTVAIPHTRPAYWEQVRSLIYMYKPRDMVFDDQPGLPVDIARNILVTRFLGSPQQTEYILFADSDATWAPTALMRLLERELPIVSAVVYRRGIPPVPTAGPYVGLDSSGDHTYDFGKTVMRLAEWLKAEHPEVTLDTTNDLVLPRGENDLLEVDGVGAHFLLIHRDVLEQMQPPWFKSPVPGQGGEDFYFSRKARAAGIKIQLDMTVHTGHLAGDGISFGVREFLKYLGSIDGTRELWAT